MIVEALVTSCNVKSGPPVILTITPFAPSIDVSRSCESIAFVISSRASSAAASPISGLPPAPKP